MGCTSSAPNMAHSSTAEKSIQFEDENSDDNSKDVEEIIYRAADDTNVLPSCDTLSEPVHLDRNKSTPSLNNEPDNPENGHISESIIKVATISSLYQEDKVSNLKEVVDKMVGFHKIEQIENSQPEKVEEPSKMEETADKNSLKENNSTQEKGKDDTEVQDGEKEDHTEESPSPSEINRATRWEALADIQAELPPSLTIDPITGQIYVK